LFIAAGTCLEFPNDGISSGSTTGTFRHNAIFLSLCDFPAV
jgi:hypothetical protein